MLLHSEQINFKNVNKMISKNRSIMKIIKLLIVSVLLQHSMVAQNSYPVPVRPDKNERIAAGKFQPTWESLKQYETPEWFRNAKFGICVHWRPQC